MGRELRPPAGRLSSMRLRLALFLGIACAVCVTVTGIACGGGETALPRTNADVPSATQSPAAEPAPPAFVLREEPVGIPGDGLLLLLQPCRAHGCQTPVLERVYRGADGSLHHDRLFPAPGDGRWLLSFAVQPGLGRIVATTCGAGNCYPPEVITLWESRDGGVNWSALAEFGPETSIRGLVKDEVLLRGHLSEDPLRGATFLYPSLMVVTPPAGADPLSVMVAGHGEPVWQRDDGAWTYGDGAVFLPPPARPTTERTILAARTGGPRVAATWSEPGSSGKTWLGLFGGSTAIAVGVLPGIQMGSIGELLGDTALGSIVRTTSDGSGKPTAVAVPVAIQVRELTIRPLDLGQAVDGYVVGFVEGPLARVAATTGKACAPVRDAIGEGPPIACLADGVVVRSTGDRYLLPGGSFAGVRLPDGREGLMAEEDLQR